MRDTSVRPHWQLKRITMSINYGNIIKNMYIEITIGKKGKRHDAGQVSGHACNATGSDNAELCSYVFYVYIR